MQKPTVLVVDPDPAFLDLLSKGGSSLVDVQIALDRKSAQLKIADKSVFLAAICVNTKICEPFSIPLIRFSKAHRPATPLYLISNDEKGLPTKENLEELHVQRAFAKPIERTELFNAIFPYTYFELEKTLEIAKKDGAAVDATLSVEDKEMHSICAKDFLCGSKSYFDVFVRLGSGRYVKLLKAGDDFDAARVKSYLEKGVEFFYVRKEAQEFFLQFCDKLTESLLKKDEVAVSLKVNQVINFGKETSDFLVARGFNDMTIQTAQQFVKHSRLLMKDLKPQKSPALQAFMNKVSLCDHGSGTVMLLSLFLAELGYQDSKVVDVIALGGFLHDIGLTEMPAHFQDEDEDTIKDEERALYEKHPIVGADMLKGIRLINPLVPQVVAQHHERRSRHGFPYKLGPGAISPVSELIGMTDTFNQLIKKSAKDSSLDPVIEMEKKYFDNFSFQVIESFRKIFPSSPSGISRRSA